MVPFPARTGTIFHFIPLLRPNLTGLRTGVSIFFIPQKDSGDYLLRITVYVSWGERVFDGM